MLGDRLRDHIDRVGVIKDARTRSNLLNIFDDALHHINRAQRHEKAARPLRFLPNDAVLQWDTLIQIARLEAAGAVARQDSIAVL